MCKRKSVAPFNARALLGIKAFVDDNLAALQPNRTEYVRLTAKKRAARNPEQAVQIIELDPKLEVLFDDVLDRYWRLHLQPCGMGILRKQGFSVAFNGLIGDVRHSKGHFG